MGSRCLPAYNCIVYLSDDSNWTGQGALLWLSGARYQGCLENDLPHGYGVFTGVKGDTSMSHWSDVREYTGSWKKGVPHGEATLIWYSGSSFQGQFVHGLPEGGGDFVGVKGDKCMSSWLSCYMDSPGTQVKLWRYVRVYSGSWKRGVPNGLGVLICHSGSSFSGFFVNGLPEGAGQFVGVKGDKCMSSWLSFHMDGPGTEVNLWRDVRDYSGHWEKGVPHGPGILSWHSRSSFSGYFVNGLPEGAGQFVGVKGDKCMSSWLSFHMDGPGTEVNLWRDVRDYSGHWEKGVPHGPGILSWHSRSSFSGYFVNGLPEGAGQFVGVKGDKCMSSWLSFHMDGPGTQVKLWRYVRVYSGSWKRGVPNGLGVLICHSGSSFSGCFVNGLPEGAGDFVGVKGDKCMSSWLSFHMDGPGTQVKLWRYVRVYSGSWKRGVPNGLGDLICHSGSSFRGYFVNGLPEGAGQFVGVKGDKCMSSWLSCHMDGPRTQVKLWKDVRQYSGLWKNGVPHGAGIFIWHCGSFLCGCFVNGLPEGAGLFVGVKEDTSISSWLSCHMDGPGTQVKLWRYVRVYSGSWKRGVPHGFGDLTWHSGSSFKGYFVNGLPEGKGEFNGVKGDTCMSSWLSSQVDGPCIEGQMWAGVRECAGGWKNGIPHGEGYVYWYSGSAYTGSFNSSLPDGWGTFIWKDGSKYEGGWTEGEFCGIGKFVWPNGVEYNGNFDDGKPKGEGSLTWVNGETIKINWKEIMRRRRFWCQWGAQGQADVFLQESSSTQIQNKGPGAGALNNYSGNGAGAMNVGKFAGAININQFVRIYCNDLLAKGGCFTE